MTKLSEISEKRLLSVHDDLELVVRAAAERMDIIVVSGHRTRDEQEDCVRRKASKLRWPWSPHNQIPSLGVDLAPLSKSGSIDWNNREKFREMAMIVLEEAAKLGIAVTWGGTFKSFVDFPHFELKLWEKVKQDLRKV